MKIVCLDLEGVLLPEIWIAISDKTGIPELKRTTRDEPDYNKLMNYRLDILNQHNLTLSVIQQIIRSLEPLDGAIKFKEWLVSQTRLIILSDTFDQFALPIMGKLDYPTLFCHELIVDESDHIINYNIRLDNHKKKTVEVLKSLNFDVIAAGDSYNDLEMLNASDHGILFCPPDSIVETNPHLPVSRSYSDLKDKIQSLLL